MARPKWLPDNFTISLLVTVAVASLLPCSGEVAVAFAWLTNISIALLFFMHGAKLSQQAVLAGAGHWKLHLTVFSATFILFPLIGLALRPVLAPVIGEELYMGILYLCALPSTVQSSIAFVSLARGNVPAAICSAAASSLFGIFLTPIIVALIMNSGSSDGGSSTLDAIEKITVQLLLPFVAGQIARRWIGKWVDKHKGTLKYLDQSSILLVVYTAFSSAVIGGIWHQVPAASLGTLIVVCIVILAVALTLTAIIGKRLGFNQEDRITILFCGSKKSLATGVPMAQVLFSASTIGMIILPVMLFHQIQLMVCAVLAQRYSTRAIEAESKLAAKGGA
ncbi:bile acid:sodium symporter [Pseudomonas sp. SGAir0191]|uniref:bile acid:sodium symporter family protein n=1 Tax=Pseudomonas putida group TaxID=136845 RepID=UPI000C2C948F|nr:bile acid:sodium symporter family protein [Pseudomonas sp. SGAir0191]AUA33350.1 bile acid:sodium symporter [Pseudomonas sp. SGAir0191]